MTKLPRKKKLFSILITAWLALAVIFAGVFVIVEHNHVHVDIRGHHVPTSANCRICYEIQIALRIIEAFGRLGIYIALIGFIAFNLSFEKPQEDLILYNPVMLKVKFNC